MRAMCRIFTMFLRPQDASSPVFIGRSGSSPLNAPSLCGFASAIGKNPPPFGVNRCLPAAHNIKFSRTT